MPSFEALFAAIKPKLADLDHWRDLSVYPDTLIADFSNNDYLGLATDPDILAAGYMTAKQYGTGATGSRLVSGNLLPHIELERSIAHDKQTDSALIFNSGFQANATVLACLLDKKILGTEPIVFSDRLNHASLHYACQLQGIRQIRYRHNDLMHLRALLEKYREQTNPKFIVTETVFGMDGDAVDMPILAKLADEFDAFLYLDEAHATGLFGQRGYGLGSGWIAQRGLAMGTFSKALGGSGAYIACSSQIRDYVVNRCAGFIYSTAPSPYITGAAHAAWARVEQMDALRATFFTQAATLRQQLQALGLNTGASTTHIIPIILGDATLALKWKHHLLEKGLLVSAIRPPTVPPQTSRLRIALNLTHSTAQMNALVDALQDCMQYV